MTSIPTQTRTEHHLIVLDELLDHSMQLVRQLAYDASLQPVAKPGTPDNAYRVHTCIAFHHIARAVRRIILLARKLEEPNTPTRPQARQHARQHARHAPQFPISQSHAPTPDEEPPAHPTNAERPESVDQLDRIPNGPHNPPPSHSPSHSPIDNAEAPDFEVPGSEAPGSEAPGSEAPDFEAPDFEAPDFITHIVPHIIDDLREDQLRCQQARPRIAPTPIPDPNPPAAPARFRRPGPR